MPPISGSQKAPLYAILGQARLGATRLGYVSAQAFVRVDGAIVNGLIDDISITETLGEPSTVTMSVLWAPTEGHEVVITLGSINAGTPRFAGTILRSNQIYLFEPDSVVWALTLIDHTVGLNQLKVSGHFTGSASSIAPLIIAAGAPGYTAQGIEAGLPTVDGGISITFQDTLPALKQLAERIGAHVRCSYTRDVKLFIPPEPGTSPPQPVTESTPTLVVEPKVDVSRDISQFISRVLHEGGGSNALTTIAIGETILPVADASWYPAVGVVVAGPQRLPYTGVQPGGGGSLVGPAVSPVVAPIPAQATGGSLTLGPHQWAYSFVTAAGRTLPSPLSVTKTADSYTPPTPAAFDVTTASEIAVAGAAIVIGNSYAYKQVYINGSGTAISLQSAASATVVAVASASNPALASPIRLAIDTGAINVDPRIAQVLFYRSENGGAFNPASFMNVGPNEHPDVGSTAGSAYGGSASALYQTVNLSGIGLGPTGTTARDIFQTEAGGSQLKLQQTLANNTATTASATLADGSLGANAPTSDTSGLTTQTGRVLAGSTSILTPSAGPFFSTGGWALSGEQAIRYQGISGNTLTGIPAEGSGAILSTLNYGDPLDPAPALTGVTGIVYAIPSGSDVNLLAQIDDLAAQAALAALLTTPTYTHSGIIEAYLQDRRLSYDEAYARGEAHLLARNQVLVSIAFSTRDQNMRPGQVVTVTLAAPTSVTGEFIVQSVTWTEWGTTWPAQPPLGRVTSTSTLFSFTDLLRLAA